MAIILLVQIEKIDILNRKQQIMPLKQQAARHSSSLSFFVT